MDFVSEAIVSTSANGSNMPNNRGSPLQLVIGVVVALAVLRLEVRRRAADMPQWSGRQSNEGYIRAAFKVLWLYAPEVVGLLTCSAVAIYLRLTFSTAGMDNEEVFAQIAATWPVLLGADSLLAFQCVLRLLVYTSSAIRSKTGPTPLSKEPALLFLGAAVGRVMLAYRSTSYLLDGPIGGSLPVACEILSVPVLMVLSRGVPKGAVAASVLTLAVAARVALRNHLSLADDDDISDALWMFAYIAELLAAFAYLFRTLLLDEDSIVTARLAVAHRFAHVIMPLQQCLAAYYFVQAFEFSPGLVKAGHPFEILQIGGVAQLGAYAGATVLYVAEYLEAPVEDQSSVANEQSANAVPQRAAVPAA
jgi:hypothetical protein